MGLFYGSQKSTPATQPSLVIDKIYKSRWEMEQNQATDSIFVGRYVLIHYGDNEVDGSNPNAEADIEKYGSRFHHTVWMKQYTSDGEKYVQIGSMDAQMAKLILKADLSADQTDPKVDQDDATWQVTLHMPRNWKWETNPEDIDIGAELFNPHWREATSGTLSIEAESLKAEKLLQLDPDENRLVPVKNENGEEIPYTLDDYVSEPSFGFETQIGVISEDEEKVEDIKTLKGNLKILGGLIEQAYEILYGHDGMTRNTIRYSSDGPENYNLNTSSLLGLLNSFLSNIHENNELDTMITATSINNFISKLTNCKSDITVEAGGLGERLRKTLNNIVQQIIGLPDTSYLTNNLFDFIGQRVSGEAKDESIITKLNNKQLDQLQDVDTLLAYLNESHEDTPILNLYTLTRLGRYLLETMSMSLTSVSKPNHLKAFKFNNPVGGSLKNLSDENWKNNLSFHVYLENNDSDQWFNYARGGLLISVNVDGSERCLAYLPKKVNENDPNYFVNIVDGNEVQKTHFNVDLSATAQQEGWITWRNHDVNSINTGRSEFDTMAWVNQSIVNEFSSNVLFTATLFYNVNGVLLYEQKKLKLLTAPYYLFVYDTCRNNDDFYGDNFVVISAQEEKNKLTADWEARKTANGWTEESSTDDINYIVAKAEYQKKIDALIGDVVSLAPQISSKLYPMNTGDLLREAGAAAEITDEQNRASRATNKYVYIFSRSPVSTIDVIYQDENGQPLLDENGNYKYAEQVLGFNLAPEGQEMSILNFTGGFSEKKVVFIDTDSNVTYNYLYRSDAADPIDQITHSSLEMIISPEPAIEENDDITLTLTPFVGAKDTQTALNIAGYDGVQGIVPQPLIGDEYAYLMGNGTWSHLRAAGGLDINANSNNELVVAHEKILDQNIEKAISSMAEISSLYASQEDILRYELSHLPQTPEEKEPGEGQESSTTATTYYKYISTVQSGTKKFLNNQNAIVTEEIKEHSSETSTCVSAADAAFTTAVPANIPIDQWESISEKAIAEEVIDYFNEHCTPNSRISFELLKTTVTQRLWDNNLANEFYPQQQISTFYTIVKKEKDGNGAETSTVISPVSETTQTKKIETQHLDFNCSINLPYFELDNYGHVIDAGTRSFQFLETKNFELYNDADKFKLSYRYPSGQTDTLFDLPAFTGVSIENTPGKMGLVPAPGNENSIINSIAFQNQWAYQESQVIAADNEGSNIFSELLEFITDAIIVDLLKAETELTTATVVSQVQAKIAAEDFNLYTYDNDTALTFQKKDTETEAVVNIPFQKNYLTKMLLKQVPFNERIKAAAKTASKIPIDSKKAFTLEQYTILLNNARENLYVFLYDDIQKGIFEQLLEDYNDYYCFLQGNGVWGPVMYDYKITLTAEDWKMENQNGNNIQRIFLPGLKARFATFAELDMAGQTDQAAINKILSDWQLIDKIDIEDDYLIAECVTGGVFPDSPINIILKVVIR